MYQDSPAKGGNWHVVYHVYNTTDGVDGGKDACFNTTVSGHIFSRDGLTWHASPVPPWGARDRLSRHVVPVWVHARQVYPALELGCVGRLDWPFLAPA
jgi:hypothetical protein